MAAVRVFGPGLKFGTVGQPCIFYVDKGDFPDGILRLLTLLLIVHLTFTFFFSSFFRFVLQGALSTKSVQNGTVPNGNILLHGL